MLMSMGPFNMASGDTQEVVIAQIAAVGKDRLNGIRLIRFYGDLLQDIYNNLMVDIENSLKEKPQPYFDYDKVSDEIEFGWFNNAESKEYNGYSFQGYNVYQLFSAGFPIKGNAIRLATYDKIDGITKIYGNVMDETYGYSTLGVVQNGSDRGVENSFATDWDYVNDTKLFKGKEYYYGVSAYYYNSASQKSIETPLQVFTAKYKENVNGNSYGEQLELTHLSGNSDIENVSVTVVDPDIITGHKYKINFSILNDNLVWNLQDQTAEQVLLHSQNINSNAVIIDGLEIRLTNNSGVKEWNIPSGERKWTWTGGANGYNLEGFNGAIGYTSPASLFSGLPMTVKAEEIVPVLLKLASVPNYVDFDPQWSPNDINVSYGYRFGRAFGNSPAKPEFTPYIVNVNSGDFYSYQGYEKVFLFQLGMFLIQRTLAD